MKKILASMFLSDVISWELPIVDLGEGPGGPRPPSYFGKKKKKESQKEEKTAGQVTKKPAPPPLTQGLDPPLTANN